MSKDHANFPELRNAFPVAAQPGTSRHERGNAIDVCDADNPNDPVANERVRRWVAQNGKAFGFIRTVRSETWHFEHRARGE
jgi:zinc D-Ala-D-Ala carboxypeptidase